MIITTFWKVIDLIGYFSILNEVYTIGHEDQIKKVNNAPKGYLHIGWNKQILNYFLKEKAICLVYAQLRFLRHITCSAPSAT